MVILKIYLFRHGESFYNRDKEFTGWKDSKLTKAGIKNAKKVAQKLKTKKFQIAYHTRLARSKNTLKEVLKFHPECKQIIKDDRMIERSYGKLQGKKHTTIIKKFGQKQYEIW
ncbi:MAG: histidine phosphatase family protein, partial [Nanoarchaeota archaeon]|nr:histidine phosphatase family protein [Nanoarchaeota archaeon]